MTAHNCDEPIGYTPHPDDPLPSPEPMPEPFPGPFPRPYPPYPRPWPWPPDWWRCLRRGGVSGRYEGGITTPTAGTHHLDLRVDIDPRHANSPVMNRLSGDFYQVFRIVLPGRRPLTWRVYRESWIVDDPQVTWYRCRAEIIGQVRFWKGVHPATTIQVRITWTTFGPVTAEVTFVEAGGSTSTYSSTRTSDCFRDLNLEVDVCNSVNLDPILPVCDTHWHATRPADLPQRTLTIEEAYREAGISVTIRPDSTIIDDSAPEFSTWSVSELHDAMENHFSQYAGSWPKWEMWGLLAGTFDNAGVGGIMFDAAAVYGGSGEPPERQGFAVFRNHAWFNNLVAGTPANQDQAWAMRQFLYTWVHEAGHAFNFLHSWNKARPDSLSWMNYDWRYDARNPNGANSFWSNFRFRFDDEELIHMRHGDRASVIMGGDPWASGGHLESPPEAMAQLEGDTPIDFSVRSQEFFEFMEPVTIELRLRNLLPDIPLDLDTNLHPEYGGVIVYIRRPDGRILEYAPILCKLAVPQIRTLKPAATAVKGEDRFSEEIFLSYGSYGFYFDEPGDYLVRAVYQGAGEVLIPSNLHRLRIGRPPTKEEDRLAQDFFTYQVGMSLFLNGSRSRFLAKGMDLLENLVDRYKDTFLGAKVATALIKSVARPFFQIDKKQVLTKTYAGDPEKALSFSAAAQGVFHKEKVKALNLVYHKLVRDRADCLAELGQPEKAKKEVATLRKNLAARGVNEPVLNDIKVYEDSL